MLDLSNIFNKDIKKAILSKEQLAEMLKVTPEAFLKALEAFERSYQLCVPNGMIKAVKEDWIPRISENYWPSERD